MQLFELSSSMMRGRFGDDPLFFLATPIIPYFELVLQKKNIKDIWSE